ncbi:FtsB family cell division protein [Ostreiculturibacter nitratireducens]|uniref:FtsB family cell division protein n=1 Tax=Ostreiculturibacter nitratireducens TaxID=3075226 RepID=UPI0031B5EB0B
MSETRTTPTLGTFVFFALAILFGGYFTFAAVQGDYGVFRRVQIDAEAKALKTERDRLAAEVARMENLTLRLSDTYLDLDLLDEQARDVLGVIRADEIVIR